MKNHPTVAIAAGALVAVLVGCPIRAAAPFSQQPGAATRSDDTTASQTAVRVRGTIDRYDTATRSLRVTTAAGPQEFVVPRTAHVSRRGDVVDVRELERLAGSTVVVRYYQDAEGRLTVKSIHVLASSATARP